MANAVPKESASISFEISVLSVLDKYCFDNCLDRSQVVQRAVQFFLAGTKAVNNRPLWEEEYQKLEK